MNVICLSELPASKHLRFLYWNIIQHDESIMAYIIYYGWPLHVTAKFVYHRDKLSVCVHWYIPSVLPVILSVLLPVVLFYHSVCLSAYFSAYFSVYLFACLSVVLPVYLPALFILFLLRFTAVEGDIVVVQKENKEEEKNPFIYSSLTCLSVRR